MMDLYKLIVVDDEFVIRDGLMSFKWEKFGFRATGSASDGEEALELMKSEPADLIITDLKMPLMDGITLIDKIRELYPNTKLIILTGYKDFEYAQKAISAGVIEYLLKPVDLADLESVALKMKSRLDEDREKAELFNNVRKQLMESKPLAVENFLRSILEEKLTTLLEIEEKMDLLEIYLERAFYACAVFEFSFPHTGEELDAQEIKQALGTRLNNYLNNANLGYHYFDSADRIVLLFNFDLPGDFQASFEFLANKVGEIHDIMEEVVGNPGQTAIYAGCGCIYNNISYLPVSYRQAVQALQRKFFEEGGNVFYVWKEKSACLQMANEYPYEAEDQLIDSVLDGNRENSAKHLDAFWNRLELATKHTDPGQCKNMIVQLLNMLERRLNKHGASLREIAGLTPPFTEFIQGARTLSALRSNTETVFDQSCGYISELNKTVKTSSYAAVQQTVKYIDEHFNEKIVLNDLAEKVYLNPSYLCMQFKKEIGKSFVDYIKYVRIEKAKELLKGCCYKAYEISEMVGYHDYKYFTETFKGLTGLSPLEFRQKLIAR